MKKKLNLYLTLTFAAGILLSLFMIYCFYNHVTVVNPYTTKNQLLPLVENAPAVTCFVICCIIAIALAVAVPVLTLPKAELCASSKNNIFQLFSTSLLGFLFGGYVFNFIITPFRKYWSVAEFPGVDLSTADSLIKIVYYAGIIVSVPCAVYFLVLAVKNEFKPDSKIAVLSVSPVIWLSLRLVYYFISTSAQVNVAGRKIYIISLCFALFFFLQDSKRWIPYGDNKPSDKESTKHSRLYLMSGFGAIISLLITHISFTYLQTFWIIEPTDSYLLNAIMISMILFICFRLAGLSQKAE